MSPTERRIHSYMNASLQKMFFPSSGCQTNFDRIIDHITPPKWSHLALCSLSGTLEVRFRQEIQHVDARVCVGHTPLFISPFGRSEGVDGGRALRMTCPIYRAFIRGLPWLGSFSLFFVTIYMPICSCRISLPISVSCVPGEAGIVTSHRHNKHCTNTECPNAQCLSHCLF